LFQVESETKLLEPRSRRTTREVIEKKRQRHKQAGGEGSCREGGRRSFNELPLPWPRMPLGLSFVGHHHTEGGRLFIDERERLVGASGARRNRPVQGARLTGNSWAQERRLENWNWSGEREANWSQHGRRRIHGGQLFLPGHWAQGEGCATVA